MATSVLLGMSEDMGMAFTEQIRQYTKQFSINQTIISIAHNLPNALVRYHPDILLINPELMEFDTPNEAEELLKYIYAIRKNPAVASTRVAAIVSFKFAHQDQDKLISKLIALNVWDIFKPDADGRINIYGIADQLLSPASLSNVEGLSTASELPDISYLASISDNSQPSQYSPSPVEPASVAPAVSADELSQLKQQLADARRRESQLAASRDERVVAREDYDDLLKQVKDRAAAAPLSERLSKQFQSVLVHYDKQQKKLDQLSQVVKDQNELIKQNNSSGDQAMIDRLSRENDQLKKQLGQANSQINSLSSTLNNVNDYSTPTQRQSRNVSPRRDDYEESSGSGLKPIVIAIVAILLVGLGTVMFALITHSSSSNSNSQVSSSSVQSKPSFNSLMQKSKYAQAAKLYPNKAVEAENQMLQDSNVDDRASVAQDIGQYSTAEPIQLDVAYFNKDFNKVVDIWNESTDSNVLNPIDQRRVMIAYSLMKTNNLADAKKVAKPLNSSSMNERIKTYEQFYEANKILENKIKNGDLSQKDKEKAKKQIEQNKEAMDKL